MVAFFCFAFTHARADLIYDNSAHDQLKRFSPGVLEVGDEISFAGTSRSLTNFAFEYYGTNVSQADALAFLGDVEARVRFYANDGLLSSGYASPGSILWDTEWFSLPGVTPRSVLEFSAGLQLPEAGLPLPATGNFTWTVQFRGMDATDVVGLDIYGPPDVGTSWPDYWENSGTSWVLRPGVEAEMNFAARFEASPVPEPSTVALSVAAGLLILLVLNRRR